jgi:hypothetical protein
VSEGIARWVLYATLTKDPTALAAIQQITTAFTDATIERNLLMQEIACARINLQEAYAHLAALFARVPFGSPTEEAVAKAMAAVARVAACLEYDLGGAAA